MLNKQGLESFLEQSLLDFRLDNQERAELRAWLDGLDHSERNFIRNRAFDLARDAIEKEPDASQSIMFWLQKVVKTSFQNLKPPLMFERISALGMSVGMRLSSGYMPPDEP